MCHRQEIARDKKGIELAKRIEQPQPHKLLDTKPIKTSMLTESLSPDCNTCDLATQQLLDIPQSRMTPLTPLSLLPKRRTHQLPLIRLYL